MTLSTILKNFFYLVVFAILSTMVTIAACDKARESEDILDPAYSTFNGFIINDLRPATNDEILMLSSDPSLQIDESIGTALEENTIVIDFSEKGSELTCVGYFTQVNTNQEVALRIATQKPDGLHGVLLIPNQGMSLDLQSLNGAKMASFNFQDAIWQNAETSMHDYNTNVTAGYWDRFLKCVASKWDAFPWWIDAACDPLCNPGFPTWACYSCVSVQGYWGWLVITYCLMWS